MPIISHISNLVYFIAIVIGGAAAVLSLINSKQEKKEESKRVAIFVVVLFVYMFFDFVAFYFIQDNVPFELTFTFILIAEIMFYVLLLVWLKLIVFFCQLGKFYYRQDVYHIFCNICLHY